MPDELKPLCRVEMHRINGDIYINGKREIFAVDAGNQVNPGFQNVDWLIGWAKKGLISAGHTVLTFDSGEKRDMQPQKRDTSTLP